MGEQDAPGADFHAFELLHAVFQIAVAAFRSRTFIRDEAVGAFALLAAELASTPREAIH